MTAVVRDAGGAVNPTPALTWTTSAAGVATVTNVGSTATITAVNDGAATIVASTGSTKDSVKVTVRRRLAKVEVTAPSPTLTFGTSMQMVAIARDARGHELTTVTSFSWASNTRAVVLFNTTGLVTALFSFNASQKATVTAEATLDGVTVAGSATVDAVVPQGFDHAALMLSEFEIPARPPSLGEGIAYFTVSGARIDFRMTWNQMSSPAIEAHIHGPGGPLEVADVLVDLAPTVQTTPFGAHVGSIVASDIRARPGHPRISLDSLIALMGTGKAYVDVHSRDFAGGEIRGRIDGPLR